MRYYEWHYKEHLQSLFNSFNISGMKNMTTSERLELLGKKIGMPLMRNDSLLSLELYDFYLKNERKYFITESLSYILLNTKINSVKSEDILLPYDIILLEVPNNFMFTYDKDGKHAVDSILKII